MPPHLRQLSHRHGRASQRGLTLVEILIAFLVLSIGLLASSRLQSTQRLGSDAARERTEALQLAQREMERSRASVDGAASGDTPYGDTGRFHLQQTRGDGAIAALQSARVAVEWSNRGGQAQSLALQSAVGRSLAVYSAVLTLPAQGLPMALAHGAPPGAQSMGNDQRVLKGAGPRATTALTFSARTGHITSLCSGIDANKSSAELSAADLQSCTAIDALLLSGYIRFSLGEVPNAEQANDRPLPLQIQLRSSTATPAASCESVALQAVSFLRGTDTHTELLPIDAAPASVGASHWTALGERFVSYQCVVPLLSPESVWRGELTVQLQDGSIGPTAAGHKVCRYRTASDNPRDTTTELELRWSLAQHNYLVIRGDQACPSGVPSHNGPLVATVQHQP